MGFFCKSCRLTYHSEGGFRRHQNRFHRLKKPRGPRSTFQYHDKLTACPCDSEGQFLPFDTPPPPPNRKHDWRPFTDRDQFELTELLFKKVEMSAGDVDQLMRLWLARNIRKGNGEPAPFKDMAELLKTVDDIEYGGGNWHSFGVQYAGPSTSNAPSWQHQTYAVHTRNVREVLHDMIRNPDFSKSTDFVPYREFIGKNDRRFCNFMSGDWAWKQADAIAEDPRTHGAFFCPTIFGADKTTVSVATGNVEFHPVYMSCGNLHNTVRRAHKDGVVPVAFLAIPKAPREHEDTDEFRLFRKHLYHESLRQIMEPLRSGMTEPEVVKCGDGHYRKCVYGLGPFIADYPEQVLLAGTVQGWCPKCLARPHEFDSAGPPRFQELTEHMLNHFSDTLMWDAYGIHANVKPYTWTFPRADIHELLTPDILHQLVKGTFKDHLVAWIEQYLYIKYPAAEAKQKMDEIDRRIAAVPAFPGLRRFPEGRNFKQWTGNDSKALMKVYLPAIAGLVPAEMTQCIQAFLDFCYLARRSSHDSSTLRRMDLALAKFHSLRVVFEREEVRPDGISLPRQHAMVHYVRSIKQYGSPNGLCTSITESKHITAVKRPWRRSSRNNALPQIIRTNTRLSKLSAARVEFGRRGMLHGTVVDAAIRAAERMALGLPPEYDSDEDFTDEEYASESDAGWEEEEYDDEGDAAGVSGPRAESWVEIAQRPAMRGSIAAVARRLGLEKNNLQAMCRRFLQDDLYPDIGVPTSELPLDDCPNFTGKISVFHSARATFYAPSELSGPGGMHCETIRSNPQWRNSYPRYDTVLVANGDDDDPMGGLVVARVRAFLKFVHDDVLYPCALVEWLLPVGEQRDPVTGMWVVKPEMKRGRRVVELVHIDCVIRACHLVPVFGKGFIPTDFHFSYSLDAFKMFYVNHYIDYHSHECVK